MFTGKWIWEMKNFTKINMVKTKDFSDHLFVRLFASLLNDRNLHQKYTHKLYVQEFTKPHYPVYMYILKSGTPSTSNGVIKKTQKPEKTNDSKTNNGGKIWCDRQSLQNDYYGLVFSFVLFVLFFSFSQTLKISYILFAKVKY